MMFLIIFCILKINYSNSNISQEKISSLPYCGSYEIKNVQIDGQNIKMDVSDTDCKRELGLSGRKNIPDGTGMLFVFDEESSYGFWMKEMNFPIDIIWVDNDFAVTGIEKSLSPETYPEIFGEKYPAKYVLELPSGFSNENNIKVGNKISIL